MRPIPTDLNQVRHIHVHSVPAEAWTQWLENWERQGRFHLALEANRALCYIKRREMRAKRAQGRAAKTRIERLGRRHELYQLCLQHLELCMRDEILHKQVEAMNRHNEQVEAGV